MTRDFRKAASIYDQLCNHGDGDLRACTKLLEVASRLDRDRDNTIARTRSRMCDRGEKFACIYGLLGGKEDRTSLKAAGFDLDQLPHDCATGDVSACRFLIVGAALASVVSSSNGATQAGTDAARVSLRADEELTFDITAAACTMLLEGMCDPGGKRSEHDWAACFDFKDAFNKKYGPMPAEAYAALDTGRACLRALTRACDAGSVEACEPLTGRMISSCDRCAAGDQAACGFSDVGTHCTVAAPAH